MSNVSFYLAADMPTAGHVVVQTPKNTTQTPLNGSAADRCSSEQQMQHPRDKREQSTAFQRHSVEPLGSRQVSNLQPNSQGLQFRTEYSVWKQKIFARAW
ncbi:uncharacterized protein MCYG_06562 [Microsporum canis CBS 113480]|uniref:Uncharacterized protein n=1 Tax=Arthroderma otae (strain ATCC MYA-4605 / CBS 113480) TaxID=554155 RepID=C5FV09_ARTOC|nr:uncharacterized protein MCYG_06562 [Microsporum canis CBS 113480]EEQ33743.1 predicted protein [Microsporum canis CBS 113480]